MDKDQIKNVADLARVKLTDEEAESLAGEMAAILGYVEDVKKIRAGREGKALPLKNVMRPDEAPHEGGIYTEKILADSTNREGQHIKVKKIL